MWKKCYITAHSALDSTKNLRFFNWIEATNKKLGTEGLRLNEHWAINNQQIKSVDAEDATTKVFKWFLKQICDGLHVKSKELTSIWIEPEISQEAFFHPRCKRLRRCFTEYHSTAICVNRGSEKTKLRSDWICKTLFNEIKLTLTWDDWSWSWDNFNSEIEREKA